MAIRDKMRSNARPFVKSDETIEEVFGAQTVNQWWALVTLLILLLANRYVVVVVTDRRILVCKSGRFTTTKITEIMRELPRQTVIGPARGLWWKCGTLGQTLYVHKRFHGDVASADGSLAPAPQ